MIIKEIPDTRELSIIYNNGETEEVEISKHPNNMYYEVEEIVRLINSKENAHKHNKYSVMEVKIMDEVRSQLDIKFPADL
ncbi:hypothetical protein D3C76_1263310 [compost metagenome]